VDRACGTHGRGQKRVQGFDGEARMKRPLERPSSTWEDGFRMDIGEIGRGGVWGDGMDLPEPG
jgi:hypothetical protein